MEDDSSEDDELIIRYLTKKTIDNLDFDKSRLTNFNPDALEFKKPTFSALTSMLVNSIMYEPIIDLLKKFPTYTNNVSHTSMSYDEEIMEKQSHSSLSSFSMIKPERYIIPHSSFLSKIPNPKFVLKKNNSRSNFLSTKKQIQNFINSSSDKGIKDKDKDKDKDNGNENKKKKEKKFVFSNPFDRALHDVSVLKFRYYTSLVSPSLIIFNCLREVMIPSVPLSSADQAEIIKVMKPLCPDMERTGNIFPALEKMNKTAIAKEVIFPIEASSNELLSSSLSSKPLKISERSPSAQKKHIHFSAEGNAVSLEKPAPVYFIAGTIPERRLFDRLAPISVNVDNDDNSVVTTPNQNESILLNSTQKFNRNQTQTNNRNRSQFLSKTTIPNQMNARIKIQNLNKTTLRNPSSQPLNINATLHTIALLSAPPTYYGAKPLKLEDMDKRLKAVSVIQKYLRRYNHRRKWKRWQEKRKKKEEIRILLSFTNWRWYSVKMIKCHHLSFLFLEVYDTYLLLHSLRFWKNNFLPVNKFHRKTFDIISDNHKKKILRYYFQFWWNWCKPYMRLKIIYNSSKCKKFITKLKCRKIFIFWAAKTLYKKDIIRRRYLFRRAENKISSLPSKFMNVGFLVDFRKKYIRKDIVERVVMRFEFVRLCPKYLYIWKMFVKTSKGWKLAAQKGDFLILKRYFKAFRKCVERQKLVRTKKEVISNIESEYEKLEIDPKYISWKEERDKKYEFFYPTIKTEIAQTMKSLFEFDKNTELKRKERENVVVDYIENLNKVLASNFNDCIKDFNVEVKTPHNSNNDDLLFYSKTLSRKKENELGKDKKWLKKYKYEEKQKERNLYILRKEEELEMKKRFLENVKSCEDYEDGDYADLERDVNNLEEILTEIKSIPIDDFVPSKTPTPSDLELINAEVSIHSTSLPSIPCLDLLKESHPVFASTYQNRLVKDGIVGHVPLPQSSSLLPLVRPVDNYKCSYPLPSLLQDTSELSGSESALLYDPHNLNEIKLPPLLSHDDFVIRPSSADIIKKVKPPEELIDKKKLDSLKKENERKIIEKPKPEKNPTPAPRIGALNMSDFETYQKYAKLINDYASSIDDLSSSSTNATQFLNRRMKMREEEMLRNMTPDEIKKKQKEDKKREEEFRTWLEIEKDKEVKKSEDLYQIVLKDREKKIKEIFKNERKKLENNKEFDSPRIIEIKENIKNLREYDLMMNKLENRQKLIKNINNNKIQIDYVNKKMHRKKPSSNNNNKNVNSSYNNVIDNINDYLDVYDCIAEDYEENENENDKLNKTKNENNDNNNSKGWIGSEAYNVDHNLSLMEKEKELEKLLKMKPESVCVKPVDIARINNNYNNENSENNNNSENYNYNNNNNNNIPEYSNLSDNYRNPNSNITALPVDKMKDNMKDFKEVMILLNNFVGGKEEDVNWNYMLQVMKKENLISDDTNDLELFLGKGYTLSSSNNTSSKKKLYPFSISEEEVKSSNEALIQKRGMLFSLFDDHKNKLKILFKDLERNKKNYRREEEEGEVGEEEEEEEEYYDILKWNKPLDEKNEDEDINVNDFNIDDFNFLRDFV